MKTKRAVSRIAGRSDASSGKAGASAGSGRRGDKLDRELRQFCDSAQGKPEAARANLFFNFARKLFTRNSRHLRALDQISAGAEQRVILQTFSGFADFVHERLIMEFKRDLSSPTALKKAKKQLWNYFQGLRRKSELDLFGAGTKSELWRLVATDGVVWRVFGVNYHSFHKDGELVESADDGLVQLADFDARSRTAAEFRDFLRDAVLCAPERRLSAVSIHRDFGVSSPLYRDARRALQEALPDPESGGEAAVAHNEWREYFSRVYGSGGGEAGLEKFHLHTYLATFAKILGWHVLNRRGERMDVRRMDKNAMRGIIDGAAFQRLGVEDFAARDFFAWTLEKGRFDNLYPVFKRVAKTVANYIFESPGHDLLQGVYQDVVDADTRHSLGEYYTPDWLCERMIARVNPARGARILDPACGSGSFLRAAAAAKMRQDRRASAAEIAEQTVGMDIHPVAVQLAKTNLLMALGAKMQPRGKKPRGEKVRLRVYLANTLLREEQDQIVRRQSRIRIKLRDFDKKGGKTTRGDGHDSESVVVTVRDQSRWFYNEAIALCDELSHCPALIPGGEFARRFAKRLGADLSDKNTRNVMREYREVYRRMRAAKATGQNSIWAYVLKNLAQPLVLRGEFDHVVGNPPWLTYKDVKTADYQREWDAIAEQYRLKPGSANKTHMELATLFASHCASAFLAEGGRLAFVMSASILNQGNHEPIRQGRARGFMVREIWDLSEVRPLFNIKSMVLFADRSADADADHAKRYREGFGGQRIAAKLPNRDVPLDVFTDLAEARNVRWRLQTLVSRRNGGPKTTMFTNLDRPKNGLSSSEYEFRQGATLVPRCFCFVESMDELTARDIAECGVPVRVRTADRNGHRPPWKGIKLEGRAAPDRLCLTAVGEHLFPFCVPVSRLALAHLPMRLKGGRAGYADDRADDGASGEWFERCRELWESRRTENNRDVSFPEYMNWNNKLLSQPYSTRRLVLYNASGQHVCAAVLDRESARLPFVAESKTYYHASQSADECGYLAAVLNAPLATSRIRVNIERDIHTRIQALPIPRFNSRSELHKRIVKLHSHCERKAAEFADTVGLTAPAQPGGRGHGHLRGKFRAHLADELAKLDGLVRLLFDGKK